MTQPQWDHEGNAILPFYPVDRQALARAAVDWLNAGASVLPVRLDGTKAPGGGRWKDAMVAPAELGIIAHWFKVDGEPFTDGMGIVTGAISGNLEMLELEGRAYARGMMETITAVCDDNGIGDVWRIVTAGYVEVSGGLGLHFFFRTEGPPRGSVKLAVEPDYDNLNEHGGPTYKTLIETRGEGGFVVTAPSAGRSRKQGGTWYVAMGSIATIPVISVEQRDHLYAVLGLFNQAPARTDRPAPPVIGAAGTQRGERPGDQFNEEADWDSPELLTGAGWRKMYPFGPHGGYAWARPGKSTPGLSATTGQAGSGSNDRLYVFSSSTDWPINEPLTKFWIYAQIHHAGDLKAATKDLAKKGFGTDDWVDPAYDGFEEYEKGAGGSATPPPAPPTPSAGHAAQQQTMPSQPPGVQTAIIDSSAREAEVPAQGPSEVHSAGDEGNTSGDDGMASIGLGAPDTVPDVFPPSVGDQEPSAPRIMAGTQAAHSQLLINEFGPVIRYCADLDTWLHWDRFVWRKQARDGGTVYENAKRVAAMMSEESDEKKRWKRAALSSSGVSAALRLAQTNPAVRVDIKQLDAHPWELNTPAGVLDLHTGDLLGPIPQRLHTKSTLCEPDFDADLTAWTDFLATTFGGDKEIIDWMQRLLGYACIGEVLEHILPVFYGVGQNGKSVLLEVVQAILGDYSVSMPPRYLVEGAESTSDTAMLIGVRLALISETNEGERFAEALAKRITGGDTLTGRLLYRDWISWTPSHTAFLMTNHLLEVPSGGRSFWRRIRQVPFNNRIPDADRDERLKDRLITEHGPAILAWLARGAFAYSSEGLADPAAVRVATSEYERSTDTVGRFVEEECRLGEGSHYQVPVKKLRDAYEAFCRLAGDTPVSTRSFTTTLLKRWPVTAGRSTTARYYVGIRIAEAYEKEEIADVADPSPYVVDGNTDEQTAFWSDNR